MSTITVLQDIQKMSLISASGENTNLPELITSTSMEIMNFYIPMGLTFSGAFLFLAGVLYLRKKIRANRY